MKAIDADPFNYAKWNAINYCMSADFLLHYAEKYPEPPENPFHSDLGTILEAMRSGERYSLLIEKEVMERTLRTDRWSKALRKCMRIR